MSADTIARLQRHFVTIETQEREARRLAAEAMAVERAETVEAIEEHARREETAAVGSGPPIPCPHCARPYGCVYHPEFERLGGEFLHIIAKLERTGKERKYL